MDEPYEDTGYTLRQIMAMPKHKRFVYLYGGNHRDNMPCKPEEKTPEQMADDFGKRYPGVVKAFDVVKGRMIGVGVQPQNILKSGDYQRTQNEQFAKLYGTPPEGQVFSTGEFLEKMKEIPAYEPHGIVGLEEGLELMPHQQAMIDERLAVASQINVLTQKPGVAVKGEGNPLTDTQIREQFRYTDGPSVKVIARTVYGDVEIDDWCKERGINYTTDAENDADALAEFAGRVCYYSLNPSLRRPTPVGKTQNGHYLDHIREVGHGSVTEHASWTFLIDDLSKNTTQELVRHRVGVAYSVQSSRYVDFFSGEYFGNTDHRIGCYVPPEVQEDRELFELWKDGWVKVYRIYTRTFDKLRSKGLGKKEARSVARHFLPGGACNALCFTVNARELSHIFKLRGSLEAEREFRNLAVKLYLAVADHNMFKDWEVKEHATKGPYLYQKKWANVGDAITEVNRHFPESPVGIEIVPSSDDVGDDDFYSNDPERETFLTDVAPYVPDPLIADGVPGSNEFSVSEDEWFGLRYEAERELGGES